MLEELQVPYEINSFKFEEIKQKPFIDINPNGRVPGEFLLPPSNPVENMALLTLARANKLQQSRIPTQESPCGRLALSSPT